MWEHIQSVVLSLGVPEVVILLVLIGAGIAYFGRSKRGPLTKGS